MVWFLVHRIKMGKAKRIKPSQIGVKATLEQDIEDAKFAKNKNRNKIRLRKDEDDQVSSVNSIRVFTNIVFIVVCRHRIVSQNFISGP